MATQHPGLKKVGDYWHFELRINGQRLHGSTRAKDVTTAKRILEERRKEALLTQCGAPKVPTLSVLAAQWLKVHKGIYSKDHWDEVERVSRNWLFPPMGSKQVDHIRTEDIAALRSRMLEAGRSPVILSQRLDFALGAPGTLAVAGYTPYTLRWIQAASQRC